MAEKFVELIAELKTDDKAFRDGMQRAEKQTKTSAAAMQTSLNKANVSAVDLNSSMGAMGNVAAAVGGQFGGMTGQVIAAGTALKTLGVALFGVPGLLIAAGAAAVGLAVHYINAANAAAELTRKQRALNAEIAKAAAAARGKSLAAGASAISALIEGNRTNIEKTRRRIRGAELDRDALLRGLEPLSIDRAAFQGSAIQVEAFRSNKIRELNEFVELEKGNLKKLETERLRLRLDTEQKAKVAAEQAMRGLIKQADAIAAARGASRLAAAQGALIATGGAKLSEFTADPVAKQIQQLLEEAAGLKEGGGRSTSFGTGSVSARQLRFGGSEGGFAFGQQKETVTEQKTTNKRLIEIRETLRDILRGLTPGLGLAS